MLGTDEKGYLQIINLIISRGEERYALILEKPRNYVK